MSRARKISSDLRHVATLAGTTAAVVEGAAIAVEKARSVGEHLGGDHADDAATVVDAEVAARSCCCRKRTVVVLILLTIAAVVGIGVWRRRSAARDEMAPSDDRGDERFAGSMP